MMFAVIIFVGGAIFVVAYSLWEMRSISNITLGQAAGVGTAALIVLLALFFILSRTVH
jgi:hypothetical protein